MNTLKKGLIMYQPMEYPEANGTGKVYPMTAAHNRQEFPLTASDMVDLERWDRERTYSVKSHGGVIYFIAPEARYVAEDSVPFFMDC
jgi:hypothetical protein